MSDLLTAAIRQYRHNNGDDGFVCAYEKHETDEVVASLVAQRNELLAALEDAATALWSNMANHSARKADAVIAKIEAQL